MSQKLETGSPPLGFKLRSSFAPLPVYAIGKLAWSPDGHMLAFTYNSHYMAVLHSQTGQILHDIEMFSSNKVWNLPPNSLSWSPGGQVLAVGDFDSLEIWDVTKEQRLYLFEHGRDKVSWSPDGALIACSTGKDIELRDANTGTVFRTLSFGQVFEELDIHMAWSPKNPGHIATRSGIRHIHVWDVEKGQPLYHLPDPDPQTVGGREGPSPSNIAWSPDGRVLAWGEGTVIRLWNIQTNQLTSLEGHTAPVIYLAFSPDGSLLATKARDHTIRFWYNQTRETIAILTDPLSDEEALWEGPTGSFAFSPRVSALANIDRIGKIRIWDLDLKTIFVHALPVTTVHYCNAKVVLLGESGTGKSGLALSLTGQPFVPTVSTHGRNVWLLDSQDVNLGNGRTMTCEALLWDLAGQPGYRLVHQLHLNEVAVALVVFDARSETDPFAGVYHWHRALEQARRVQGNMATPVIKLLVAARTDRGGIGVSRERINALLKEMNFDDYFETSAKEGWGIAELKQAILAAIPWQQLPQVSSTQLFQQIKDFLLVEKESGRLQPTSEDLYHSFLRSKDAPRNVADLRAQFETCIGRVESRGLIRRLSFGKLVLLQPEKLDAYASALVNAVKEEPDGLGSIAEELVLQGRFKMPQDERIPDKQQEKVLLIAMVEDLLSHEIALREQADDGPHLVFPSQSTRENPDLPDPEGKSVIFSFEGPVLNIYATLTVRLSHSGLFKKQALWKNAATYTTKAGGTCGLFLHNIGEGRGELTLFFQGASEESSYHFDEYVDAHLMRRALPETVKRHRIFVCSVCGFIVPEQAIQLRRKRGLDWLDCLGCDTRILLSDKEARLRATPPSLVPSMDQAADQQRNSETARSIFQGKQATNDFDVFLCYTNADKEAVKLIGGQLKEQGILPWLDEWELRPGMPWQRVLEEQISQIKTAAVFVGQNGIGPWQHQELDAFLREFASRGCPVIPVLLANAPQEPALPVFLKAMTWVDFRVSEPDPMQRLLWGITGRQDISRRVPTGA